MSKRWNRNTYMFWGLVLLVVAFLVIGHGLKLHERVTLESFRDMLNRVGGWQYLLFVSAYVGAALLPFPTTVLSMASGAVWGLYVGTAMTVASATLAACVPFALSRWLGRRAAQALVQKNPAAHTCDRFAGRNGFMAVLAMRLIPVLPWDVVNYLSGLCGIRFRDYLLASVIGTIPASFTYNLIGASLGTPIDRMPVFIVSGLVLAIGAILLAVRHKKRIQRKAKHMNIPGQDTITSTFTPQPSPFPVEPLDEHNKELLANVHPSDWTNPDPQPIYNLVVIGGGTAGLITAAGAAGLGAKVALIERHLMGGDCLNVGCVPSKALIRPSRLAAEMRQAERFGLAPASVAPEAFPKVMERLRRIRAEISHHDSAQRYRDELGVDMFIGEAKFSGTDSVEVDGKTLRFKKAVIATGARAVHPKEEGLEEVGFRTNETIFNLTELPRHLIVIGGGPIGCELAQAFRRLGAEVSIVQHGRFLPKEDPDASALIATVFEREGIRVLLDAKVKKALLVEGRKQVIVESAGKEETLIGDEILIGAGRAPNVEGLNLETVGVAYDARKGIQVDDQLRTTNSRIFAAGDCCMAWKFTHAADAAARLVIQNALFKGRAKLSALTMPWCTYTDPEVAHVGLYEADAKDRGIETDTFRVEMAEIDRARTDGETQGFIKVLVRKGTDKILGATIVSTHAGEMISEITTAMAAKAGLGTLAKVIHPYPTQAEAIKRVADAYSRTRLTTFVKKLFTQWMTWQRRG
ncbi:MAG: FAD-containing oxidoreductase [Roseovarius sp.]